MNPDEIASLISGSPADNYADAIKKHMYVIGVLNEYPPTQKFRGEFTSETSRRHYWQRKTGKRWTPWDFICAYPMLSKNARACFQSREQVIRDYFSAASKKSQQKNAKKYKWKPDPRMKYLNVKEMVRVVILGDGPFAGRAAYVTALHPTKGYRVTIWPDERWKSKVRRWCQAADIEPVGGGDLPDLPPA